MSPKYTLVYNRLHGGSEYPYVILEHVSLQGGGIMSKSHGFYGSMDTALKELSYLSGGDILLAMSAKPIDNVHDLSRD